MNISITEYTPTGQEVRPGVVELFRSNLERPSFAIRSICDALDPQQWHGEVSLAGRRLICTAAAQTAEQAGRAAEAALLETLVRLLAD